MGTPSHLGHMDRVAATMPSQAHAGAAQEAPDIGQWEGQDVSLVGPSSCIVKGGIPSSRRYLPTYLYHGISMSQSFALHPDMTPSVHHLGLCPMSPSLLTASFLFTLQSGGWGLLLPDPPRTMFPRVSGHFSPVDPVLQVVAAPSCSAPEDPVQGVRPPFVPELSSPGPAAPAA